MAAAGLRLSALCSVAYRLQNCTENSSLTEAAKSLFSITVIYNYNQPSGICDQNSKVNVTTLEKIYYIEISSVAHLVRRDRNAIIMHLRREAKHTRKRKNSHMKDYPKLNCPVPNSGPVLARSHSQL